MSRRTVDNSPPLQWRGRVGRYARRRQARLKRNCGVRGGGFSRPYGTGTLRVAYPALKRRATIRRPSGRRITKVTPGADIPEALAVARDTLSLRLIPRLWCGCSGLNLNSRLISLRLSSA